MVTLQENAKSLPTVCTYLFSKNIQKLNDSSFPFFLSHFIKRTICNVSPSRFSFQSCYLSFNQQTLSTCDPRQKPYMVSQKRGLVHMLRPYLIRRTPIQLQPIPIIPRDNPLWRAKLNRNQSLPPNSIQHLDQRSFPQLSLSPIFWNQPSGSSFPGRLVECQMTQYRLVFSPGYCQHYSKAHHYPKTTSSTTFSNDGKLFTSISSI
jgi:hypothetical protein